MTQNQTLLSQVFIRMMKYFRNFLPWKEILCKKLATGRKISYHRKKILSQEEISSDRKKFGITKRNLMSQEEISCCRMIFPVTEQNFLSQEENPCHRVPKLCLCNILKRAINMHRRDETRVPTFTPRASV